jgi:hypothetical protein
MRRWEARLLAIGVVLTGLSGLVYAVMKYLMAGSDPDSRFGHPWQPDVLKAHILVAPILLFGLGVVFRGHVAVQLQREEREGRRSGLAIAAVVAPLVFSGYLLQAFTGEVARQWTGWLHTGLGLVFAFAYLRHRRRRSRSEVPAAAAVFQGPAAPGGRQS